MDKFKKSSFSFDDTPGGCVYVSLEDPVIKLKDERGNILNFTPHEWKIFIKGVKNGEFDLRK